jgi:monovalent cation/hydrogen antiporter
LESVLPVVLMLLAVLVSSVVAQVFPKAPASLVQIALGVLLAVTPVPVDITLDPEFFLVFFIAPLLYWDAMESDKKALWSQRKPVLALALGLVLLIVLVVGFFTHLLVPSIPLAAAFALGAALGPTDAVAVTTLGKRLAIDKEQKTLLQGECLLNDASGVVSFQFAIAALVTGTFSLIDAGLSLVWSFVGGIVLGAVLAAVKGVITRAVRRTGLEDVTFHVLLQILTPFAFYLVAEELGVSGILAVVAAGIVESFGSPGLMPSSARLNIVSTSVWKVISFALNGMCFVLLGTLLPNATARTWAGSIPNTVLIVDVLLISVVLVAVRFLWCLWMERVKVRADGKRHKVDNKAALSALVLTLAGPKGAVTLSICLTVPRVIGTGEVLQCRELLIFLGAGVILVTLLLANFVVPLLVPKKAPQRTRLEETQGRVQVLRNVIRELTHDDTITDKRALRRVIATYETRIDRIKKSSSLEDKAEDALRERAVSWEAECVNRVVREGRVAPIVGYSYLFELERKLSHVHHKGELKWFVKNLAGWFGVAIRAGFADWGLDEDTRMKRRRSRDLLRRECAEHVIAQLGQLEPSDGFDEEAITHLTLEYQRIVAAARASESAARQRLTNSMVQTDTVMRRALQIEREQIRAAYDAEIISRETVRTMRDNVSAIEFGLQE